MINHQYNFDDTFIRMINIALIKTFTRCIVFINHTSDGKIRVPVPFYLSLGNDSTFVIDAFVDDIPNSRIELNSDIIPRGVFTFNSISSNIDELANSNQFISKKTEINSDYREIITKVKAIPSTLSYDVDIVVMTEIDAYKVIEKIQTAFYNYAFMNIEYFGLKLDAYLTLPDDTTIEIVREQSMESDTKKHIKFSLNVESYYPVFQEDTDDHIVCINDDDAEMELYWAKGCKKKPSLDDDISSIKRVNWKAYMWDYDMKNDIKPEDRSNLPTENF